MTMQHMTTILDKEQATYIYYTSYLSLCSCLYATYRQQYDVSFLTGTVFLTSINYWRHPTNSYRRFMDITAVNTALFYQNYMLYNAEYANIYYTIMFCSFLSYMYGIHLYNKKEYWNSTYAHMGVHIFANIANIVVYSGRTIQ